MLTKKSMKIISVLLLAVVLFMAMGNVAFAAGNSTGGTGGMSGQFNPDPNAISGTKASDLANTILGALKWAGVAIAIGMMIFLGIKYVTSSPEGKANLKGQLGIYILGLVFILAATVIVGILENAIPQ